MLMTILIPGTALMASDSDGAVNLRWIWRFQLLLLPLGTVAWALKSIKSSVIFLVGGLVSLVVWRMHKWAVVRMLSPSKKQRWFFALVGISKLALIAILLHVIVKCFPLEVLPFVTGLLLFVAAILLEAARLVISHIRRQHDDNHL